MLVTFLVTVYQESAESVLPSGGRVHLRSGLKGGDALREHARTLTVVFERRPPSPSIQTSE